MLEHLCHCDQPLRTVTVSDFGEQMGRNLEKLCAFGLQMFKKRILVFTEKEFRGKPCFSNGHAILVGTGQFTIAFKNGQLLLFPFAPLSEADKVLDAVILGTGNEGRIHWITFINKD